MGFPAPPPTPQEEAAAEAAVTPPWDPHQWVHNPPKTFVQVQQTTRSDLNGQLGLIVGYDAPVGRYLVHLCRAQTKVSLKPDKLQKASLVQSMVGQVQIVRYNPDVQQQVRLVWQQVTGQGKSTLFLIGGSGLVLGLFLYRLGFTKSMVLTSYLLMGALVVGPDLVSGRHKSLEEAMNAIPANLQKIIRETLPFGETIASSPLLTLMLVGLLTLYVVWIVLVQ